VKETTININLKSVKPLVKVITHPMVMKQAETYPAESLMPKAPLQVEQPQPFKTLES
jgi:hypothetical protein